MDEIDRRLARPSTPDVIGLDDFLELLGTGGKPLSRQRLHQLRETDPAFPKAVARGVWLRTPAERYAAARNTRTGRPPKTS
ncbi:hypothetical protein [Pseudonocardia sp. T1-2H]|uniref:hypothetical protein n=1 Tax=Pseudonocardia sp. T1-2H TaxID=3128899 RepID=UPI0031018793